MAEGSSGLADRIKEVRMRDASEGDPEALARALAEKASLADRIAGAQTDPEQRARVARSESLAERMARIQHELVEREGAEAPVEEDRRQLMDWFMGRRAALQQEGPVTPLPPYDRTRYTQVDFYPVEEDFAFVRILEDTETGERLYQAIEPPLSPREKDILEFVNDALIRGINTDPYHMTKEQREEFLVEAVRQILLDYSIRIDPLGQQRVEYYVRRNFLGLGRIHVMMLDPEIEDISCDGADEALFIFHRQYEAMQTDVKFDDDRELDRYVIRLAQRSGKAISISEPVLDAALPDDSRLQATLGREVTQNGSTFTIRRFRPDPFTAMDLVKFGTFDLELLAWFWMTIQHGKSLIFSGGTASGKTTSLNAVCQYIPYNAKIVSIEDTREVNLPHKNWVKATTRVGSSVEGQGEIGMFELLKAALRQRPEYILVGEVRGIEATVAFQAMATGHTVYATMHADSARSVVYRLENEPINIPRLVLQALDVIAIQNQVRVDGKRVRRVMEVVELVGMDPTTKELLTNTVARWDPNTDEFVHTGRSYILDGIAGDLNWTRSQMRQELDRRKEVLQWIIDYNMGGVAELTKIVRAYYRDPEAVLALVHSQEAGKDQMTALVEDLSVLDSEEE